MRDVPTCPHCGAVVADLEKHDAWHRALTELLDVIVGNVDVLVRSSS